MVFRKNLATIAFLGVALFGACSREQNVKAHTTPLQNSLSEAKTANSEDLEDSHNLYIHSGWTDSNKNNRVDEGELLVPEKFFRDSYIEICFDGDKRSNKTYLLSLTLPEGSGFSIENQSRVYLAEEHKMPGTYTAKFYIDGKLAQEKSFEVVDRLVNQLIIDSTR